MSCVSPGSLRRSAVVVLAAFVGASAAFGQDGRDPDKLLAEAERLAWLKAWPRAAPLYAEAERLFAARGDDANALYAQINGLRGRSQQLPVPEVSERLADYLENPLVKADERVRLRCLVIKGEIDEDLDPQLAERSWREAGAIADRLGERGWANRAKGELGVVAFLRGDVDASVIQLGQALKMAESIGDTPSVVRWLTLFGHGYIELARPEQALSFYERALKVAASGPELRLPVMTYLGKGDALTKLGRLAEAEQVLADALKVANAQQAFGYQAELSLKLAAIAENRQQTDRAATLLAQATASAQRAGANRILADIALARGRLQRRQGQTGSAARILEEGVAVARAMQERFLLPRLLAELADLRAAQRRYTDAANLLKEGTDLLEGILTKASSPWVQGRIINGARELFAARIRLEGARGPDAERLFSIVEQARGRALLELLLATPIADVKAPAALRVDERRIAALQVRLFHAKTHAERQKLLDQIFVAEEQLAPLATALFDRTRRNTSPRRFVSLQEFQRLLRADELFLEFALDEPRSYVVVVSRDAARVQSLPGRSTLRQQLDALLDRIGGDQDAAAESAVLTASLLGPVKELSRWMRVIVSPDAELHRLPFDLLPSSTGRRLIDTHVFSYVPSGSVLAILRERQVADTPPLTALAVSASPDGPTLETTNSAVTRRVFDIDAAQLRPLPFANDEARSVTTLLGPPPSYILHSSPNRLHVLWRASGFTKEGVEALQKRLAKELGTDKAAVSCAQLTRLPGYFNHKYRPAPLVAAEYTAARRDYWPTSFPIGHNAAAQAEIGPSAASDRSKSQDVRERARRYLAAIPPAIAGEQGDASTFRVCCRLVRGFSLSDIDALVVLAEWNSRCQPPWTDRELTQKLSAARKYGKEPVGGLL